MRGRLLDAPRLCSVDTDTVPEAEKGQGSPIPGGLTPSRLGCLLRKLGEWLSPLTPNPLARSLHDIDGAFRSQGNQNLWP